MGRILIEYAGRTVAIAAMVRRRLTSPALGYMCAIPTIRAALVSTAYSIGGLEIPTPVFDRGGFAPLEAGHHRRERFGARECVLSAARLHRVRIGRAGEIELQQVCELRVELPCVKGRRVAIRGYTSRVGALHFGG